MYKKKMAKIVLSNPTRALDITANIATAAVSRSPKNVMKTLPQLITFYNAGKRLHFSKFVKYSSNYSYKSMKIKNNYTFKSTVFHRVIN